MLSLHTHDIQRTLNGPLQVSPCLRLVTVEASPVLEWLTSLCRQVSRSGSVPSSQLDLRMIRPDLGFSVVIKKPSDRLLTYGLCAQCCLSGVSISHFGVELSRGMIHSQALALIDKTGKHGGAEVALRSGPSKRLADLPWHLNAYAIDPVTGADVLMTSDHIYPKALGGPDHWANRQAMLSGLNNAKGLCMSEPDRELWATRKEIYPFLRLVS